MTPEPVAEFTIINSWCCFTAGTERFMFVFPMSVLHISLAEQEVDGESATRDVYGSNNVIVNLFRN